MVTPIDNNITTANIMTKNSKQSKTPASGMEKDSPTGESVAVSLGSDELKVIPDSHLSTRLNIAAANREAASFNLEDKDAADKVLRETLDLMKQNPEIARLAQNNIDSQIVMGIFQA